MNTLTLLATTLAESDSGANVAMAAMIVGPIVAIVAIVMGGVEKIERTKAKEQSRREIAAYIAEGSMTPEDGRRLMEAGAKHGQGSDDAKANA